jgi:hypothetical protein
MDLAFLALLAGLVGGTIGLVVLCDRLMGVQGHSR